MEIEKRIIIIGAMLGIVVAAGVIGYTAIEKWPVLDSLYMTVITIATVGYTEVHELSRTGRIFTIFLILGGTISLVYAGSSFVAFFIEGQLTGILGRRKMEKKISQLSGHYIVCGAGATGRCVSEEFLATGTRFVVIENNMANLRKISGFESLLYIQGDATSDAMLKLAGIDRAAGLVTTLPTDKDNLFVTLTARNLNPKLRIVAKAEEDGSGYKMKIAGAAAVVSPTHIGGLRLASETMRPAVTSFLDRMLRDKDAKLRIAEYCVSRECGFAGTTLEDLDISGKTNALVLAVKRQEEEIFNPTPDVKLLEGDVLIVMATVGQMDKLRALLEGK
ncbi:hypothetical protein AUJ67_07335 [Candidatus Desantisbacteria bacterium CG1_02_49_89]|nr:MAG: hypothetical protein AUJ67_07335 [Candidatus Desantisbacteria bacterium CG1_02_49_89]